jgi:tetratricopeptide (TPR) repeat protein
MGVIGHLSPAGPDTGLRSLSLRRRQGFLLLSLWYCLCTAWMALEPTPVSAIDRVEESGEYDFDLSKGLYLYSIHKYPEAERYLSKAVKVKPGDSQAGYYLGQILLRSGRYDAAEEQYREILRRHPADARARLGLGMTLYHQGRFMDALTNLSSAETNLRDEPLVYYYEGLAAAALQSFAQASEKFLRAGALDPELAQDPQYKLGASEYAQGKSEQAAAEFRRAVATDAPSAGRPGVTSPGTVLSPQSKRWDLRAALSLQYDSNVVLLPSGVSTPGNNISRKDDFVTVLAGGGEYRFIQDGTWTAGAGYGFYQNIHGRLSDFNVQDHTPTIYVQRRLGSADLRFQYLLDYVTVGGDSYLLSNTVLSTLTVPESERTYTQAYVRYQNKDFKDFQLDRSGVNPTRDANNWMVGGMQYLLFQDNRGHVRAGYTFDTDRTGGGDVVQAVPGLPSRTDWSYIGHRFSTGIALQPAAATTLDLAVDYYRQGYDNPNSFSVSGATVRKDNIFLVTGTATRDLRSWLWVAFQYSYTRDDANIAAFSYVRNMVSFTLGGRF